MNQFSNSLLDQLVDAYLPKVVPAAPPSAEQRLMNPQWPAARWDVSGAFIHDQSLGKMLELFNGKFHFLPFRQVSGAPA